LTNVNGLKNFQTLQATAKRRLPGFAFDFADGGVDDEVTLRRNQAAFDDLSLIPLMLRAVENASAEVDWKRPRYKERPWSSIFTKSSRSGGALKRSMPAAVVLRRLGEYLHWAWRTLDVLFRSISGGQIPVSADADFSPHAIGSVLGGPPALSPTPWTGSPPRPGTADQRQAPSLPPRVDTNNGTAGGVKGSA
jgi:hypothetical protein